MADAGALLLFLALCVGLRIATLGHTNFHDDDLFYFLVGQRMHDGLLPYVDIWDRKPFGLFAIYYLIAAISREAWAYQVAGWCFIAATAWVIHRIVLIWTNRQGAILAGLAYVAVTYTFGGENGQAPVFYNLFIAAAVLLVVTELQAPGRQGCGQRIWIAMALCGVAITIKQTALFESLFLGIVVLASLWRRGLESDSKFAKERISAPHRPAPPSGHPTKWYVLGGRAGERAGAALPETEFRIRHFSPARLIAFAFAFGAVGAIPMLAIAAFYGAIGHWHEFWTAMVAANFNRPPSPLNDALIGARAIAMRLLVIAPIVGWTLMRAIPDRAVRRFLSIWLLAAFAGFLAVPNFFVHYALPLLVPVCVVAGFAFGLRKGGSLLFAAVLAYDTLWHAPFEFDTTRKAVAAMDRAASIVARHDGGGGLFVFKGPSYLYALTGKPLPTPLAFPHHLNHALERDVSHVRTGAEIDRIIARRPGVVVIGRYPPNYPVNRETFGKVSAYVRRTCRSLDSVNIYDNRGQATTIDIHGDCGPPGNRPR